MRIALFLWALLACFGAVAAPNDAVTLDRSTWPESLSSPALFDVASRAEILSFAHALLISEMTDESALKQRLGLKQINLTSINRVRERLWRRLLENYNFARQSCDQDASFCYYVEDMDSLKEQAGKFRVAEDSFYARWAEPSRAFHQRYLDELLRLAALFPQSSSEIALFGEPERNGEAFNDRLFLLTFDGGPGALAGHTEQLTGYLRRQKMHGLFFVLGSALQARVDKASIMAARDLYNGQCVGILGWQYRSHGHWQDWQDSVKRSAVLAQSVLPENYLPLFRPPYGQRQADSGAFFTSLGLQVVLWDIDSLDATGKLTAEQSAQRVMTLMLLWRRGVIVFHDTQDKALGALSWLLQQTAQSGLGWKGCNEAFR
ncbi:polysaccharide deacetylase [Pseudomonas agarici]|uniref:Polysaccharide deacetylase n=1 Tax=Pseudomonas agarici TaxID=46677 RepID=A0A0X1SXQ7_PSEAA|nr:polysaccharide deacetylase family protein [Pseudomonas agarici]AMB84440.1 polysaccharide deacetylase [Pseudomonas agarici]NWB89636.1 polysaccharide deacetylase family protein [Pseudomonas agarici]NWC10303.1 polysaccharide deacetylase family protein [Pseudomonas agarici]SEK20655.1 Peptidoglycan/xylan/chitin deacetylase, PgdA/CDA1 family [Pseudomonas agarici]